MSFLPMHALRQKVADESVEVILCATDGAGRVFDRCSPLLEPAIAYEQGRLSLDDVRERVTTGWMHLWVIWEMETHRLLGVLVTEFAVHPQGKALNIVLVGGHHMQRWLDRLIEVERWAKSEGCRWIELSGRFGWERVLRGLSYQRIHTTLGKELS